MRFRVLETPLGWFIPQRRAAGRWVDVVNQVDEGGEWCQPRKSAEAAMRDCSEWYSVAKGCKVARVVGEFELVNATRPE